MQLKFIASSKPPQRHEQKDEFRSGCNGIWRERKRKISFSRERSPSHLLLTLGNKYFPESTKLNDVCMFLYFSIVDQRSQFTKLSPSLTPKMSHFSVKIHTDLSFFPSNIKIFGKCTKRLKVRNQINSKEIRFLK